METKEYAVGYGKGEQKLVLPAEVAPQFVEAERMPKLENVQKAVLEALRNPVGSEPLGKLVSSGDKVVIVVSDITRAWGRTADYLPYIVDELNAAGVPDEQISLLVATGTHRSNTDAEKKLIVGENLFDRLRIFDHDAFDKEANVYVGTTTRGTPAYLDKLAVEADKVILTGAITPHLFAGFGGGRKSVMPGISAAETINHNHLLALTDEVGGGINTTTCTASVEGNRVNEDMCEVAAFLKPAFLVNSIVNAEGELAAIVAGDWYQAWREGATFIAEREGVLVQEKNDIFVTSGGGYPRDINLYQGIKAYVPASMTLKEGGVLIAVLECEDISEPPEYFNCFKYNSLSSMEDALRANFSIPFYIAFFTCYLAERFKLLLVTKRENFELVRKTGAEPVEDLQTAYDLAVYHLSQKGITNPTLGIAPHGAAVIPYFEAK